MTYQYAETCSALRSDVQERKEIDVHKMGSYIQKHFARNSLLVPSLVSTNRRDNNRPKLLLFFFKLPPLGI